MIPLRDNIPCRRFPITNWILIALNVYIFSIEVRFASPELLEKFIYHWAVIPSRLWSDFIAYASTLVTAAFLHGGWLHIISNMIFLYIFGDNVEDRMGHFRYLFFYLLTGVIANGAQAYLSPQSQIPLLGASGAIAGVLGAYFFYYPHARVLTLIPFWIFSRIVEIPAFLFLGFWFFLQTMSGTMALSTKVAAHQPAGGIAFWAHVSGFIAGLLLSPAFGSKSSRFK